jgi:hypothetical protein
MKSTPQRTEFSMSDLEKLPSHPGFFKVINPLYVFKKAYTPTSRDGVIINLIIPKGAIIFPGNTPGGCLRTTVSVGMQGSGKLRASKAIVHSISTFKRKFNLYDELQMKLVTSMTRSSRRNR